MTATTGRAGHRVVIRHVVPPSVRLAVFGTFLILFLGALYYARGFVLPLVLACLLTLTLSPLVTRLAHWGVPAAVSALLLVGAVSVGAGMASLVFSGPFAEVAAEMPDTTAKVRDRLDFLREPIAALNHAGRDLEGVMNGTNDGGGAAAPTVVVAGGGLVPWLVGTLTDVGTTIAATLVLAVFLLASIDALPRKLIAVTPALSDKKRSLRVLHEIENDVSRYLVTVTAINAGLGVLVGGAMAALGLGNGIFWGAAVFVLNFIPYAGATIGIALAAAVSLATFDSLAAAAAPPLVYLALQLLEGSFVTPMILGRRLSLSPIAILTTLSLTTWMWGIVGTIIGVPLLVVFKVFCDQFPTLGVVGVFLSSEPVVDVADDDHQPASWGNRPGSAGVVGMERRGDVVAVPINPSNPQRNVL